MKRFLLASFYLLCTCIPGRLLAQGENNVWVFGHHNGLDFNNNPPTFFQSNNFSIEGSSSVSDAAGNLLFYSNGRTIWDANGIPMPNGTGLQGNGPATTTMFEMQGSCSQGVAIVKSPADPGRYYMFTLDAAEDITPAHTGSLRYSIIDMALNGGMGDVVPGQKDIVLDQDMNELMTVVRGAGCYYWLICHRNNSAVYRAFKIDGTGIQPAVSSTVGSIGGLGGRMMQVSFAGDRILGQGTGNSTEIGHFNNATGVISNMISIDHGPPSVSYGSCFSPDDTKIYLSGLNGILQYDISAYPNTAAVAATRTVISTAYYSQLRNGPDGKIYIAAWNNPFIATINQPNNAGAACGFNATAMQKPTWSDFGFFGASVYGHGLGSDVPMIHMEAAATYVTDTLICLSDTFRMDAPEGFHEYLWDDGSDNDFRTVSSGGRYWLVSHNGCQERIDSFYVNLVTFGPGLGPDTFLCPGGVIKLDVSTDNGSYTWQDGSHDPAMEITGPGTYAVAIAKENCVRNDTISISAIEPFLHISPGDSLLCYGTKLQLHAATNIPGAFSWNNGGTTEAITIDKGGQYNVTHTSVCGILQDAVTIEAKRCDCGVFIPNAFSPNDDGLNDQFAIDIACTPRNYLLSVYNRFGQRVFVSTSPARSWDGSYDGRTADVGVYFYMLSFEGQKGKLIEEKGAVTLIR